MALNKFHKILYVILIVGLTTGCAKKTEIENLESVDIVKNFEEIVYGFQEEEKNRFCVYDYMDKNIIKVSSIEGASSMVNTFIYFLYENLDMYTRMIDVLQDDFKAIEKDLEVADTENIVELKVPDEYKIVKSLLEELNNNFMILKKINNTYVLDVDFKKIRKAYYKYVDKDTLKYIDFRIGEDEIELYDANLDEYNIELLLSILDEICKNIENLEGVSQRQNWIQHLCYYLDIMFSVSQNTFVDNENIMKNNIFDEISSQNSKNKESSLSSCINEYLKLLKNNNYDVSSDKVDEFVESVYEKINDFLINSN